MKYTVIRDTREKPGWGWAWSTSALCEGTVIETVKVGDYTLRGYEDIFGVERKQTVLELCANLVGKLKQFENELERADRLEVGLWVVCEFTWDELERFPVGAAIPPRVRRRLRVGGKYLLKKILELEIKFPKTRWHLVGHGKGKDRAGSIFKRMIERERNGEADGETVERTDEVEGTAGERLAKPG